MNFSIEPKAENVTISYLKSLPMFGSEEWLGSYFKIRTRALFRLGVHSKNDMLQMFKEERMALLIETLPKANGDNDSFRLVGVNVIVE